MRKQKVTITVSREIHQKIKQFVEQGKLKKAGAENISQAYELALRLLINILET